MTYSTFSFLARESCIAFSGWAGGWHGRERCGFQGFEEAGLRLRTDNSGNCVSPSGSSLVAANLRLAGLRFVSEFPGAKGFPRVLGKITRGTPVRSYRRTFQTRQARRIARRRRRVPVALIQREHYGGSARSSGSDRAPERILRLGDFIAARKSSPS